jgi:hypothetical protein
MSWAEERAAARDAVLSATDLPARVDDLTAQVASLTDAVDTLILANLMGEVA